MSLTFIHDKEICHVSLNVKLRNQICQNSLLVYSDQSLIYLTIINYMNRQIQKIRI